MAIYEIFFSTLFCLFYVIIIILFIFFLVRNIIILKRKKDKKTIKILNYKISHSMEKKIIKYLTEKKYNEMEVQKNIVWKRKIGFGDLYYNIKVQKKKDSTTLSFWWEYPSFLFGKYTYPLDLPYMFCIHYRLIKDYHRIMNFIKDEENLSVGKGIPSQIRR